MGPSIASVQSRPTALSSPRPNSARDRNSDSSARVRQFSRSGVAYAHRLRVQLGGDTPAPWPSRFGCSCSGQRLASGVSSVKLMLRQTGAGPSSEWRSRCPAYPAAAAILFLDAAEPAGSRNRRLGPSGSRGLRSPLSLVCPHSGSSRLPRGPGDGPRARAQSPLRDGMLRGGDLRQRLSRAVAPSAAGSTSLGSGQRGAGTRAHGDGTRASQTSRSA